MEMMAGLTTTELISMLSGEDVYRVVFTPSTYLSKKEYTLWVIAKALFHRIALIKRQEEEDINACSDTNDELIVSFLTPYSTHINTHHRILACFLTNNSRRMDRLAELEELDEREQDLVFHYKSLFPMRSIPIHWEHVKYMDIDKIAFGIALRTAYNEQEEDFNAPDHDEQGTYL